MSLTLFQINIYLIKKFISKLRKEDVPALIQKLLVKTYANTLRINLTDAMIEELFEQQMVA